MQTNSLMRRMSLTRARKVFTSAFELGLATTMGRGFHWIQQEYIPLLEFLRHNARTKKDKWLCARAYGLLGDVWHLAEAPLCAIEAYRISNETFENVTASRELGCLYSVIGDESEARKWFKRAIRLCPEDEMTRLDYCAAKSDWAINASQKFGNGNTYWECSELLASGDASEVVASLRKRRSLRASKLRARAYGALETPKAHLNEWVNKIAERSKFAIEFADWFYFPDATWWEPAFWKMLLQSRRKWYRMEYTFGLLHKSLAIAIPEPRRARFNSNAAIRRRDQRRLLTLRYHHARSNSDVDTMMILSRKYPQWIEANSACIQMRKSDKMQRWSLSPDEKGFWSNLR